MFCRNCGKEIPNGSNVCSYCGKPINNNNIGINGYSGQMGYGMLSVHKKIDNIFSALMYERTTGVIIEFSLWCTVCFVALLSLIAAIMGAGNITWIMLMLFSIGMGELMAFRLKPIAMLYAVSVFHLITFIIHFACFAKTGSSIFYADASYSALNIVLFILLLLLALAIVICGFIHFFSRFHLGNVLTIMVLTDSSLILILQILMYAVSHFGEDANELNEWLRGYMNYRGYWVGTITFWVMITVVALLYSFFFWGCIDSRKGKIINLSSPVLRQVDVAPGIRGISGEYLGQVIFLQGRTITIGSAQGMTVLIQDSHVSGRHCAIRFNPATGFYEIFDDSTNGVFLNTGMRLQKGVFNSVQRGSVIWIGSNAQQFQLL